MERRRYSCRQSNPVPISETATMISLRSAILIPSRSSLQKRQRWSGSYEYWNLWSYKRKAWTIFCNLEGLDDVTAGRTRPFLMQWRFPEKRRAADDKNLWSLYHPCRRTWYSGKQRTTWPYTPESLCRRYPAWRSGHRRRTWFYSRKYPLPMTGFFVHGSSFYINKKVSLFFYIIRNDLNTVYIIRFLHSRRHWISILHEGISFD